MALRMPMIAVLACLAVLPARQAAFAAEAAYTAKLDRLSEILGSLHFLRNLCGEEGDKWRRQMEMLIEAENPDSVRRAQLIATFNRGYRSFDSVYSHCTPPAIEAISRYMSEGEELARDIVIQFGD